MPDGTRSTHADAADERLWTGATIITFVRTVAALALCLVGVWQEELVWLVVGLGVYWAGDSLDGAWARWFDCETRIGAVVDMLCDRLNCAAFYLGFAALQPEMLLPVAVYLFEFLVVDFFLSLAFLAWPIRSPNYFYEVDRRIYTWNWSKPAKAVNSSLFAVLLLVTGWWWLGLVIAIALLGLKCVSLRWLLQLGLPVPQRQPQATR
ncbi:alcohol phosphatidyltransferase [Nocardioides dongxiaopingii]|uniref:CDP-alcohol phosphatidyltransferase family protein n=1 Tax=Nocardioides sp. S-1144 TaxID=2582905 RepID=UPI00110EE5AD|nr:CDP-alcohol phosphatidyltransferase family protein [Nocardioides sp. S-1144]QCW50575.1 alcohol phosphatidyltransferase [Nocardioides sp. S-1144]